MGLSAWMERVVVRRRMDSGWLMVSMMLFYYKVHADGQIIVIMVLSLGVVCVGAYVLFKLPMLH